MSVPKDLVNNNDVLSDWNILHAYRGSIAHNMFVPKSNPDSIDDKDTMAIYVPPKEYYLGLKTSGSRGTQEIKKDEWDIVAYEAKKAISLLLQGNPNVLSMLWVEPNHYIHISPAGQLLLSHRNMFNGKHIYRSFVGYAYSQLKKMETFERYGHMGEKRKELIQRFGYDTKNAAHLVRLLRMGIEFLTEGVFYIFRHDASQLLEIKSGKWTLTEVKTEADRLFKSVEEAYINSKLPEKPDFELINNLCVDIIETAWQERN